MPRAFISGQSDMVYSDHGLGQYRHVALHTHAIVLADARRTACRLVSPEGSMTSGFLTRRLVRPLLELLRQGVTPERLSLSIALGAALGVLPVIGCNTALCALAALIWGLNVPAIQIVNYFVYPLQIALLIPFFRLGEKLFRAPHLQISAPKIYELARMNLWDAVKLLWTTTWHALVVWLLIAPFVIALIYISLLPAFRRVLRKTHVNLSASKVSAAG
jgi:uncharacterized protein (DUF2062 family)